MIGHQQIRIVVVRLPQSLGPLLHYLRHQLLVLGALTLVVPDWLLVDATQRHVPVIKLGKNFRSFDLHVLELRVVLPESGEPVSGSVVDGPDLLHLLLLRVFPDDGLGVIAVDANRILL